jgi:hypothetical protein
VRISLIVPEVIYKAVGCQAVKALPKERDCKSPDGMPDRHPVAVQREIFPPALPCLCPLHFFVIGLS